jgi:hypothetical protein
MNNLRMNNMHIIDHNAFIRAIQDVECDDLHLGFLDREHFEMRFHDVDPPTEYTLPENFPNCCPFHKNITTRVEASLQRFPFCCERHRKLSDQSWFSKSNYAGIVKKTVYTIRYTECQIYSRIDAEDWFEDITEYFEYCVYSFGQFPSGYGIALGLEIYFSDVIYFIEDLVKREASYSDKLNKLIIYLKRYRDNNNSAERSDINILLDNYKKWLKTFPFEISYFSHLKDKFVNTIPILTGEISTNRYMGTSKMKIVSYDQLIEFLIGITGAILSSFNGLALFEDGKLNNIDGNLLEVASSKRRIELIELKEKITGGRRQYIRLIKKWQKGETAYLKTVGPILRRSIQNNTFIE